MKLEPQLDPYHQIEHNIAFYDDPGHNYEDFWINRDYEHLSEVIAIKQLLDGHTFARAMDYGGGYGRLCNVLLEHAAHVTLVDPSEKQLQLGRKKFSGEPRVDYVLLRQKDHVPADDNSLDLLIMVRVSHHLANLDQTFHEIHRALKPGGMAVIEIANYAHFLNRLRYLARLRPVPKDPQQIGKIANGKKEMTPFLNHHPKTVEHVLHTNHLDIVGKLSASNMRQHVLKRSLKLDMLLKLEQDLQPKLARYNFGPSIFYLVQKTD